jgi:demethylmenaquinone methyltransferase/2-methoxy-6-polyprenyl-1,4-benzoquinol methylase
MFEDNRDITRVRRPRQQARESYNRLSRWYDMLGGRSEKRYRDLGLRLLDVQAGEQVLEVGFGTGHCILSLAARVGDEGRVHGIDISDGMLGVATARVSAAGLGERVELVRGDAAEMPYAGGRFDAVFISFTLELFDTPEIPLVLAECLRVMKPGGRLVVVSMSAYGAETTMVRLYKWAHRTFPGVVDCRPIYARKALQEAGFEIQDDRILTMWDLPVEVVLARKPGGSNARDNGLGRP